MDLSRVDRIVVSESQMGQIAMWEGENHKYLDPHFALEEAVIEIVDFSVPKLQKYELYYKIDSDLNCLTIKVYMDNELWYHYDYDMEGNFIKKYLHASANSLASSSALDELLRKQHVSAVLNIVSLNAYMVYFDGTDFVSEHDMKVITRKKAKHGASKSAKKARNVVRLHKKYTLYVPENLQDTEYKATKKRKRHTDGWMVRGHMRFNPKTGEKDIWVPPYPKGNLRNVEAKTYKIT